MQSLGKLVASQASYYTDQLRHSVGEDVPVLRGESKSTGRADYYAGHESPSHWMGAGLDRLDLKAGGPVDADVFAGLMSHRTPSGEVMSVARSHGRVAAFDHTFSAPKSVSLLYAFGNDEIRKVVVVAHRKAVSDAVGYMEERCSQSRLGRRYTETDGTPRFATRQVPSEGYVAAGFDHYTSRANDPQVHTHVVVINRVYAEGGWRAIDAKSAYAHLKAGGTIYQSALRDELTRRLGVQWQPVNDGMADLAGFSPELVRHFSTRRVEIEAAVERYVTQTGKEAHPRVWQTFTLETRQPKTYPRGEAAVTREMKDYGITTDVVDHWRQRARTAPQEVEDVIRDAVKAGSPRRESSDQARVGNAVRIVERVADRRAVFTERDLVPFVASLYPDGASPVELLAATEGILDEAIRSGEAVRLLQHVNSPLTLPDGIELYDSELAIIEQTAQHFDGAGGRVSVLAGEACYTTRIQLEREQQVLNAVTRAAPIAVEISVLEDSIRRRGLVAEQAEAMRHLAELRERVVAVVGPGGSGKTFAIGAYAEAVQAAGHRVVGVATSAAAARKLSEDLTGAWTGTIAMMRHQLETAHTPLPAGTVIIVDEASMVSTKDLAWLVGQTEASDGKLVLVGDPKQLPSIDSGGLFHRIVAEGRGVVTDLAELNQRQTLDTDRHALKRFRGGRIASAVHDYAEAGRLHLGTDEYSTKAAMVDAWWNDTQTHGVDGVRMLASRRDEVALLNQLARVSMHQAGRLTGPVLVNRWGTEFGAGDRIVVRDNWYTHSDLRNGQTGTITTINHDKRSITFQRDLDGALVDLPERYVDRSVDHAYAQTVHTAQGQTFEATHLYLDTGVAGEHGYTALSRARGETHLWVDNAGNVLGECSQLHGIPQADQSPVDRLVRQFTKTVVEPPASSQGLPVSTATDTQLYEKHEQLRATIGNSPLADQVDSESMALLERSITEAREVAKRIGTSGARNQLRQLEEQQARLVGRIDEREAWVEEHQDLLHAYSTIAEEIQHRITARVVSYQLDPPDDLLKALGPRPTNPTDAARWDATVAHYADARIRLGTEVDLTDPAVIEAGAWRDAIAASQPRQDLTRGKVLQLAG